MNHEMRGKHERGEDRLGEDTSPYLGCGVQSRLSECSPFREVSKRSRARMLPLLWDVLLWVGMSVLAHPLCD